MSRTAILLLLLICSSAVYVTYGEEAAAAASGEAAATADATESADASSEESDVNYDGFSKEQMEAIEGKKENFEFQAEVSRLMDIIINSLYSNREIFLRELISNASDALDKIRFESLTNKKALETNSEELAIHIKYDKKRRYLSLRDNGIGMTKADLVANLGTVASSGTTKFVEAAKSNQDALSLIGQFGVGFYSVYLVADKVTVVSKNNDDKQHVWVSDAQSTFTIAEDPRGDTLGRGTEIILHLKEDAEEFLDQANLEKLVQKYSSFISFPIKLLTVKEVTEEVPIEEEEAEKADAEKKDGDDVEVSDEEDKKDDKPKTKTVKKEVSEWKQLNENKAIWTRDPKAVEEEEYNAFYKAISKDYTEPLTKVHFRAEGEISFKSILYVPKTAPSDLYDKYYGKSQALKLYVRRVLISDEFEDFMPRYLSFIKGVVDSDDLPLNVSRETLSKSRVLKVMAKKLTRKALDMLKKLAKDSATAEEKLKELEKEDKKDEEKKDDEDKKEDSAEDEKKALKEKASGWDNFWKNFGKSIKLGVIEDASNKSKLQKLLRFQTSKSNGKLVSLESYVENMKEGQPNIYYITGETLKQVENSPFLEALKDRDYEVIYMVDPLDEYLMSNMPEYDGKKFMSATKEGLKLGDETEAEKAREKAVKEYYGDLTKWLQETYGSKVEKVVVSKRVADSPCVLVTSQYGWSANMERIMKAQTFADADKQSYMLSKKTMEINPRHPIIRELRARVAADSEDSKLKDMANLMYDSALLSSGFAMSDVESFAARIKRVMAGALDVNPDAKPISLEELDAELPKEPEKEPEAEEKGDVEDLDDKDEAGDKDEL